MKNIAIITHYYNSTNYGGVLQSYALPKFLNENGYNAVQVSYPLIGDTSGLSIQERIKSKFKTNFFKALFSLFVWLFKSVSKKITLIFRKKTINRLNEITTKKSASFKHFSEDLIPHTAVVYNDKTLSELNNQYDMFICGSDQVFNFNMFKEGFFLNFVNNNKIKISYAASMANCEVPEDKRLFFIESLSSFTDISVREEEAAILIKELTKRDVKYVVDPVFLLSKNDWNQIASRRLTTGGMR